jgi:microcompartment protein CcmK/EutM
MYICVVQGKCVSTIKNKKLSGLSLVTVQKLKKSGKAADDIFVAVDVIGCSIGEVVLVTTGQNAKHGLETQDLPVDAVIVGIVDHHDKELK